MNHDLAFKAARLRGLAMQFERGELDREFAAAIEAGVDIVPLRETTIRRLRQLADVVERDA